MLSAVDSCNKILLQSTKSHNSQLTVVNQKSTVHSQDIVGDYPPNSRYYYVFGGKSVCGGLGEMSRFEVPEMPLFVAPMSQHHRPMKRVHDLLFLEQSVFDRWICNQCLSIEYIDSPRVHRQ